MRKRRSTVYVRPGKDVTLYIPAETPPEVIDYLNRLKEDGMFSQGVMDMITAYVLQRRGAAFSPIAEQQEGSSDDTGEIDETVWTGDYEQPAAQLEQDVAHSAPGKKLNLAQIFLQSKKNSGKLLDRRDNR